MQWDIAWKLNGGQNINGGQKFIGSRKWSQKWNACWWSMHDCMCACVSGASWLQVVCTACEGGCCVGIRSKSWSCLAFSSSLTVCGCGMGGDSKGGVRSSLWGLDASCSFTWSGVVATSGSINDNGDNGLRKSLIVFSCMRGMHLSSESWLS